MATPGASGGRNPGGLGAAAASYAPGSRGAFATALLAALGAPVNTNTVAFLEAWMGAENTRAAFNPLATTEDSGKPGQTNFNSIGVRNFPDFQTGVETTARNLRLGYYTNILAALMSGSPEQAFSATDEWSTFSGGDGAHYASNIRSNYQQILGNPNAAANIPLGTSSAGGSSGGAPLSSTRGIPAYLTSQYGFLINDPEVGPLLRAVAADPNYDMNTFDAQLRATTWWKTHSDTARSWIELKNTDPASYNQKLQANTTIVANEAQNLGVTLTLPQIAQLADSFGQFGWTPQELTQHLLTTYNPANLATQGGTLGAGMEQIRQTAADYGVNLNDRQAYNYSVSLAENLDPKGISATFANQAKALYPHLSPQLDQGLTLRDINAPYLTAAANLLDTNPNDLNQADPKFLRPLGVHDGKQVRQMTMDEWTKTVMSDPAYGWMHTTNARDTALNLAQSLSQTLGIAT